MIRLVALLLALASPALGETARVISGEHADFTRLVVELPQESDWTVGRIPLGYAFATGSASQPGYDLSRVWNRIPRTRLRALRADPETGALELTLACPCHVFPFEYRPGMVVLDIKDGPPPPGSSFEAAFMGMPARVAPESTFPIAPPMVYDWLAQPDRPGLSAIPKESPVPLATGTRSLGPLRDELLEQISRGASQGVVDMVLPGRPPDVPANDVEDLPWSHIRIGDMPGVAIGTPQPAEGTSTDGAACLADTVVDLSAWGGGRPALDLLSEARLGLFAEFDRVDTDAVMQSIRLHLYLGFGVEALQIADLLADNEAPEDLQIYLSMARLMDGQNDPETPFADMLGCEGAVALWAALARDRLPSGPAVNVDAIVRSFVGLPPHLRRNLGPDLSEKLLRRGDADAARIIRDAIQRSPDSSEAEVALLDAKADLQADRNDSARDHAERSIETGASTVEGLLALVEGHFRDAEPLSPDVAAALLAFQREAATDEEAKALQRGLILALALSDQTPAAFARAEDFRSVLPDLWQVAQQRATDDDFLRQAVLTPEADPPPAKPEVALAIATRLVDLGFADPALVWLGPVAANDSDQRRRVAARAEMLRGDARATLELLGSLSDPEDQGLRAKALVQLGRLQPARAAYEAAGLPEEAARLVPWQADWPKVQDEGPAPWSTAASVATGPTPVETGPLARGAALVEESATARAALEALLFSVAGPSP